MIAIPAITRLIPIITHISISEKPRAWSPPRRAFNPVLFCSLTLTPSARPCMKFRGARPSVGGKKCIQKASRRSVQMPQIPLFADMSSKCQKPDWFWWGENVTDLNAPYRFLNVARRLLGAGRSDGFEQNLAALNDRVQLHVLLFPVKSSSTGTENDSRNTGIGEKHSVRPRRHSDELLCGIRTESLPNRVADESHDRRIVRNLVC